MYRVWIILLLLAFSLNSFAQIKGKYVNLFNEERIKSTVKFLADDGFEGRSPGTRGGELAAKYLAEIMDVALIV